MEPFKIHILGCGSALPTLKHNASSQLIEMRGKCYMIDCGEGAQMQFRRSHIHFSKLNAIFIILQQQLILRLTVKIRTGELQAHILLTLLQTTGGRVKG